MTRFTIPAKVCLVFSCIALLCGGLAYAQTAESPNAGRTPATPAAVVPTNFGLMDNFTILGAADFHPFSSTTTYEYSGNGYINATGGDGAFWAPVHLPNGVLLEALCVWYYNAEAEAPIELSWGAYGLGQLDTPPFYYPISTRDLNPIGGYAIGCMTANTTIRAHTDLDDDGILEYPTYRIAVVLGTGNTHRIGGAYLHWRYQLSPAPAAATFNDVPPSDFGFQYVEALAASGITGGTGGGNYSPDDFVTRRQMAIFIAKALGLYWPE
jgi:S-layer homology domain